jgi:hypothetical protein
VLSETRSTKQHDKLSDALNELRWAAAIAGSTETAFAQRLNTVASEWERELEERERERVRAASQPEYRRPATVNDEEAEEEVAVRLSTSFERICSEFNEYLEKRLRRAWWGGRRQSDRPAATTSEGSDGFATRGRRPR